MSNCLYTDCGKLIRAANEPYSTVPVNANVVRNESKDDNLTTV